MNRIALSLLCAGFSCVACAQESHQVSGHLDGIVNDTLIVYLTGDNFRGMERRDTIAAPGGNFAFNVSDKLKSFMLFSKPSAGKRLGEEGAYLKLFAVPGETLVLSGSMEDYQMGGSAFYQQANAAEKAVNPFQKQLANLQKEFSEKSKTVTNRDSLREVIMKEYESVSAQLVTAAKAYIKAHADEDASVTILSTLNDDLEEGIGLLTDRVKQGVMAPYINMFVKQIEKEKARKLAAEKIQPGLPAPDFTLNDLNGKAVSLSSLRGKYVVIDFWGSWCGWCIKGFPEMKKAYAKHKDKVEFLGVDCNDTEQRWRDAVAKHELPWLHVRNDKREPNVTEIYAIEGYPSKCIVDPEGKIVKMVVGEDPAFYTLLDELLK